MASATTISTYSAVHKELWPQARINNLAFKSAPFLAVLKKKTDFDEKVKHIAIQYGNPQGRSAAFATAQSNASSSLFKDWQMTVTDDYAVGTISGRAVEATKSKKAAIVSALENEMKSATTELARSCHKHLFRSGTGSLGAISGATTGATITLATTEDIASFAVGQKIVASAADGGTLRDSGAAATITAIDRDAGTITSGSAWSGQITGVVDTDFLYIEGDAANNGSNVMLTGLDGWLPSTAPTSGDSFFGVDRSADPVALAGVRYDGSSDGTKKEAIQQACARVQREGNGANPDTLVVHPQDLGDLIVELGAQVEHEKMTGRDASGPMARIGFETVVIYTPAGMVKCLPDYQCPRGVAYLLTLDSWALHSLGPAPRVIEHDELRVLRQPTDDGVEFRLVSRAQLVCDAPGWNARITLP